MLQPASILCKVLHHEDMCLVETTEAILKTCRTIEKLASTSIHDLPTMKMVSSRMVHNADSSTTYQEGNHTKHEESGSYLNNQRNKYTTAVLACLKD